MNIIFQPVANTLLISFTIIVLISVAKDILMHSGRCVMTSPISRYYNKKRLHLGLVTIVAILTFYVFSFNFEEFLLMSNWKTILFLTISSVGFVFGMLFTVIFSFQIIFATRKGIFKKYAGD